MRLSKGAIETAAGKYSHEKFKNLIEEADKTKRLAGSSLYSAIFIGEAEKIAAIPQGWFSERDNFKFNIDDLPIDNYIVHMQSTCRVPLDSYVRYLPESAKIETVKAAIKNYDEKCKELENIGDRKSQFRQDMKRFASQFPTLKKLAEHNEEFAKYFFGFDKVATANLPAITCEQILEKYPEITVACKA